MMWPWSVFLIISAVAVSVYNAPTAGKLKHCSSLRLRGPYIQDQSARMGAVYHLTDKIHEGRSTFSAQLGQSGTDWIFFNKTKRNNKTLDTWVISEWGFLSFYIQSNSSHPLLAHGTWRVLIGDTFVDDTAVFLECIEEPRPKGHNCSEIRFNTPIIPDVWNIAGAVFTQINASVLGRPVFEFNETFKRRIQKVFFVQGNQWRIGENITSDLVRLFSNTNASHPADVDASWYYSVHGTGGLLPLSHAFFECLPDGLHSGPSDCSSVQVQQSPPIPKHNTADKTMLTIFRMLKGMSFHRTHSKLGKRPVFESVVLKESNNGVVYLYYTDSTWVVALGHDAMEQHLGFAIANSNAYHPADIRALWYWTSGPSLPLVDKLVTCTKDTESICTTVKIIGTSGQRTENIIGGLFDQTNKDSQGYPLFKQRTSSKEPFYLIHRGSYWVFSSKVQRSNSYSIRAYGNQSHPADVSSTWLTSNLRTIKDFSVLCFSDAKVENSANKANNMSKGLTAGVAVLVCMVVMLAAVGLTVWIKKPAFLVRIRNRFHVTTEDHLNYDVFICYKCGGPGQDFALQVLYPKLHGEWGLNTAIDAKDFVPGTLIDENIGRLVENSKRILLVLTEDFLESGWCRIECSSAHYQMATGKTKVIPVMLEDITQCVNLHQSLRQIMKTVTYLAVPASKRGREMETFWTRLKRSMPKPVESETTL